MKQHLYTKLLILYFVLGGICFLLLSSGGSYLVEKRLERSTGESLYRAASQMVSGNELRQSVKDPENASLSLALSSAAAFQNADFWVMDTDGTVLINTDEQSSGSGEITVKNFRPADYENICYSSGTFYGTFKTTQLSTVVPIKDTDQVIGYLAIHYPMKNLYESRSNIVEVMILIFIVIYALFFSFLLIYFYRVHKPLKKILKGALEFANGNLSYTIPVDSEDEMGYLSHSLNYMADKLNKNGEYQRQFISNVSHDFRSPLTSIKGYVEAMLDGTIPPEMQERYLKVIAFESTRLEKLTRSLLTLNELDVKKRMMHMRRFDINETIRTTAATFEDVTIYGPASGDASFVNHPDFINGGGLRPENESMLGLFGAALYMGNNTSVTFRNCRISGYPSDMEGTPASADNVVFSEREETGYPEWTQGWCNFNPQETEY